MRRGEIWVCELDPTVGREIQKTRPCLIVSPDVMNRKLGTLTVMPLTSGNRSAPFRLDVEFNGKEGRLLADQLRTLDKSRLKSRMGTIGGDSLLAALGILRVMFEE